MTKHKARQPRASYGSANVYADLGFPDAEEMLAKAKLVERIGRIIHERGITQTEAARILGLTQPKVSAMLKGQFRGFSERKLLDCLASLGNDEIGRAHV